MVDILIKGSVIYTMNQNKRIIKDGAIAVDDNAIVDVGLTKDLDKKYSADKIIDGQNCVVLPGFINIHSHLASIFVRGVYGVVPEGLYRVLFPIKKYLKPEYVYYFGLSSCIEAINSGITTIQETYNYMDDFAKAAAETGIRANIGEQISEADYQKVKEGDYLYLPAQAEEMYGRAIGLIKKWHGKKEGRITTCLAPLAPDMCTPDIYEKVRKASEKFNLKISTHLAQSKREVVQVKSLYDQTPVEYLNNLKLLSPKLLAAHCIHTSDADIKLLKDSDTCILYCPRPYLLDGTTVSLSNWISLGIRVGLGTDNVYHSMWETMRAALYAARLRKNKAEKSIRYYELLELATIKGAEILGLENQVGSVDIGKKADLQMIDLCDPHLTPTMDITSSLILYGSTSSVKTVIIDGKIVKESGKILTADVIDVLNESQKISDEIWGKLYQDQPELEKLIHISK